MFGMSEKSVPACFVAIAPRTIGVPVAFWPLPSPQTLLVAEATPEPTTPAFALAPAPVARVAPASTATPIRIQNARDLTRPPFPSVTVSLRANVSLLCITFSLLWLLRSCHSFVRGGRAQHASRR